MNEDEILRRALHPRTEPISSSRVLQDLRPAMRRARTRRRAAVGATAALLLAGGGAGVLALTSAPVSPTVRTTSPDDENGGVLSSLSPASEPPVSQDTDTPIEQAVPTTQSAPIPTEPPAATPANGEPPRAPEPVDDPPEPEPIPVTAPSAKAPTAVPATTAATEPVAPVPPPPAASTSQVLSSTCGGIVVEIDGRTIRIASIAPLPGYTSRVATDGPESVEMKFFGTDDGCEVHAELKASGLDVEIQNSNHDD